MTERVLVVEDNLALAENLAELLEDEGYEVRVTASASAALAMAAETGFDLALVDVALAQDEQGLDMLPMLRRHSAHGEVIVMTGNASLRTALQALEQGVYGYVPKPFASTDLLDLVRRALAQAALKREKQALAQRLAASEALYRGVVETVEAAIIGLDRTGVVRLANRFAHETLAPSGDPLVGATFATLWDRPALASRAIEQATRGEVTADVGGRHGAEPRTRTVRWTFMPLAAPRASAGAEAPSRVLAVGLDITERLALEKKQAEGEAMAAMGALATSLAHEIRNPLNAAALQLELLLRRARRVGDPELAEQLHGPAALVRTELARLASLVEDFLQLARPRLARRTACALAPLFAAVIELEGPLAERGGVRLRASVPDDLVARVDADKLKQVLLNLVRNAIEAIGADGGEVLLSAEPAEGGGVTVRVSDDGPGMPEALREQALLPFVTTKPGGTGLGLAIVHRLVAQHDGSLHLEPRDGGGTVVRITLPA